MTVTLLWDLDGTLLHPTDNPTAMYDRALAVFGCPPLPAGCVLAGGTDFGIVSQTAPAQKVDAVLRELVADPVGCTGVALPGARELLERVAQVGMFSTVVTGCSFVRANARLTDAGLDGLLHTRFGAFGDEPCDRAGLVAAARVRSPHAGPVVVVGDTPADMATGVAGGVDFRVGSRWAPLMPRS